MSKRFEQAKRYTEKYRNTLLPCRYCGNTNIHITSERNIFGDRRAYWSVSCETYACDCTANFTKVVDAVNSWNEKHAAPLSCSERNEYKRLMDNCVHSDKPHIVDVMHINKAS